MEVEAENWVVNGKQQIEILNFNGLYTTMHTIKKELDV